MKIRMTLYFPDLNVWLALTDEYHAHHSAAWSWLAGLPHGARLIFSRYTQIGILRLLTNPAVMGKAAFTLREAWSAYDQWLDDPRVEFFPEPRTIDPEFRTATQPFSAKHASKWLGDCWLLAFAQSAGASLVTFDKALHAFAQKQGNRAVMPLET